MLMNGTLKVYGKPGSSITHILQFCFEDALISPVYLRLSPSNTLNDSKCKVPDSTHRLGKFILFLSAPHGLPHLSSPTRD